MKGRRDEAEDELIDLNKEPVERKRKWVESAKKRSDRLPEAKGRVLRSRTMDMSDEEKEVVGSETSEEDEKDKSEVSESLKNKGIKGRLGRLRKGETKCGVSSSSFKRNGDGGKQVIKGEIVETDDDDDDDDETVVPILPKRKKMKRGIGRPPKMKGKCGFSSSSLRKKCDKALSDGESEEEDESEESVLPRREKMKGRPPKTEGKCSSSSLRKKHDKDSSDGESGDEDECEETLSPKRKKIKGRPGRTPKTEGNCVVSSSSLRKKYDKASSDGDSGDEDESDESVLPKREKIKGRVGRIPKSECKSGVSSLNFGKTKRKNLGESSNVTGQGMQQVKRHGRPPKMENGNMDMVVEKKSVKSKSNGNDRSVGNGGEVKRLKIGSNDLENANMKREKAMAGCAEGKEMGIREQKQLLKNEILAMLYKAGWTVEYRQRQSRDYHDAVYVDQNGKTHWSVTLAYKKLKEKIDCGKASDLEVSAFSPIQMETFSMLFRVTEKGKKAGKKINSEGKTVKQITNKESSKGKPVKRSIKSRLDRGERRTLLARRPGDGLDKDDYELYEGKRSLLSWMIDLGVVSLGGKVKYKRGRTKRNVFEGTITKDGICCDCCSITHTIRDFESHAQSELGKPYENIYLDSGNSLFQCLVDSWKKHEKNDRIGFVHVDVDGDDPNDDTCNICGDGGNLICCDSCPSTFHHGCLHIKIPSGDWHCVYCSCKFCGESISTTDGDHDSLSSEMFTCRLCDEKFHVDCVKDKVSEDDFENPLFCENGCLKIMEQLQVLLGIRHELEEGYFYTVLQYQNVSSDASLNGDSAKVENNSKLAVGFSVMDECFEPIIEERSGTNMIHSVVYNCGSNIRRLNYSGFYTIILEKGDEVVSAASIRIHGRQLAEMPFIGTRYMYRRQGMCSWLLTATETVLSSLGVEKLVIPAISELNETWTKVFGFSPVEESERQEMKYMSMIVFPGVDMLQKPVLANQVKKEETDSAAMECEEEAEHDTSSDVKTQSQCKVPAIESSANLVEHGTDSIQVGHNKTTQEEQNKEDDAGLAAPKFDSLASEVESQNHDKIDEAETVETKNSPNFLGEPKDNIRLQKGDMNDDCKLETPQSTNEHNGCLNGFLSVNGNGKIGNCHDLEISGEEESKVERQEVVC